jgi:hypothetical protein
MDVKDESPAKRQRGQTGPVQRLQYAGGGSEDIAKQLIAAHPAPVMNILHFGRPGQGDKASYIEELQAIFDINSRAYGDLPFQVFWPSDLGLDNGAADKRFICMYNFIQRFCSTGDGFKYNKDAKVSPLAPDPGQLVLKRLGPDPRFHIIYGEGDTDMLNSPIFPEVYRAIRFQPKSMLSWFMRRPLQSIVDAGIDLLFQGLFNVEDVSGDRLRKAWEQIVQPTRSVWFVLNAAEAQEDQKLARDILDRKVQPSLEVAADLLANTTAGLDPFAEENQGLVQATFESWQLAYAEAKLPTIEQQAAALSVPARKFLDTYLWDFLLNYIWTDYPAGRSLMLDFTMAEQIVDQHPYVKRHRKLILHQPSPSLQSGPKTPLDLADLIVSFSAKLDSIKVWKD